LWFQEATIEMARSGLQALVKPTFMETARPLHLDLLGAISMPEQLTVLKLWVLHSLKQPQLELTLFLNQCVLLATAAFLITAVSISIQSPQ
jgi:hypothetical protein